MTSQNFPHCAPTCALACTKRGVCGVHVAFSATQQVLDHLDCTALAYVWRYLSTASSWRGRGADAVKRSDLFRFLLLYAYGGVYADMDVAARGTDIGLLAARHGASVVWEPEWAMRDYGLPGDEELAADGRLVLIAFLLAARPGEPWFRFALERQVEWMGLRALGEARSADEWWRFRRDLAENAVTETGPNLVARALHAYRHTQRLNNQRRTDPRQLSAQGKGGGGGGRGRGGDGIGGGDDDDGVGGGNGEGNVYAMRYTTFEAKWGEHSGSCSWCAFAGRKPGRKSRKRLSAAATAASRCVDVADLVPGRKLRLPLSGADGDPPRPPPLESSQEPPPPRLADELLWVAALNGRVAVLERLLAAKGLLRKASADLEGSFEGSLDVLVERASAHVARVDLQAAVDEPNGVGKSPLFCAAERGEAAAVAFLLANGADPGRRDKYRRRPLQAAASAGHVRVVALLLAAGAQPGPDTTSDDHNRLAGETALASAERLGHGDVVRLLRAHAKRAP